MELIALVFFALMIFLGLAAPILNRIEENRHKLWTEQVLGADKAQRLTPDRLKDAKSGIIIMDDGGFSVYYRQRRMQYCSSLKWDDVNEIKTFKRDCFAFDLICWWFCCPDDNHRIEINEHMLGYDKLIKTVEARFSDLDKEWFAVAFPAFATNMSTVWQRTNLS